MFMLLPDATMLSNGGGDGEESGGFTARVKLCGSLSILISFVTVDSNV